MDYQRLLVQGGFPIDYDQGSIDAPLDLDLHVALLARKGQLEYDQLPVALTYKEVKRTAMKSAALWSLLSMAEQHEAVANFCEEESHKPGGAARLHLGSAAEQLDQPEPPAGS
jgi:hypothetical protein